MEDLKGFIYIINKNELKFRYKKNIYFETKQFDLTNLPSYYEYNMKTSTAKEITEEYLEKKK